MKKFDEWLKERDEEFYSEVTLPKWARKLAAPALVGAASLASPFMSSGAEQNPFQAERPAATSGVEHKPGDLLQHVLNRPAVQQGDTYSTIAKHGINGLFDKHSQESPTMSDSDWKDFSKLYKGVNAVGMVPNPDKPGSWMGPGGGSVNVQSKTRIDNDNLTQDDVHFTPISPTGERGQTTFNYGGSEGEKKVSGTKIRQHLPSDRMGGSRINVHRR